MSKKLRTRINHIFKKNRNSLNWSEHQEKLEGLLDMAGGLDYHDRNFQKLEKKCRKSAKKFCVEGMFFPIPPVALTHEVVAYLNRLGQFKALFFSAGE